MPIKKTNKQLSDAAYSAVLAHADYAGIDKESTTSDKIEALLKGMRVLCEEYGVDLANQEEHSPADFNFTLYDEGKGDSINGVADAKSDLGVSLSFDGYGDCTSQDHCGTPVYIEKYDGKLVVRVYGDINSEEATHNISLEGARLEKRIIEGE